MLTRKWSSDASDFILAGREISLPLNTIGVMAIGYAGTTITLAPGFSILMGFESSLAWSFVYCIVGIFIYGIVFSGFIRRSGAQTVPEFLELRYGSTVRSVVAVTSLVGISGNLANNIVSCAATIAGYTGWNQTLILAVLFLLIISFTSISGLWSTSVTDFFQVALGAVAIPTLITLLVQRYGWLDAINANWPGGDFFSQGLAGQSIPGMALTYPSVLNFVICFAAALVLGNNLYWFRVASCRSEKVAKGSFVIGGILMFLIFFIPLGLVGGYAGAFMGENFVQMGGEALHTSAFGIITKTFPALLGSVFVLGAVAASISTSSANVVAASGIATRDLYQRARPNADNKKALRASKMMLIIICLFTWILCQFPGGPTYLFAFANCWLVPPAVLIALGMLWPRFNRTGAMAGALVGMVTMAVFTVLGVVSGIFDVNQYIYLASLGLFVTLISGIVATLVSKPEYFADKNWERVPTVNNRQNVKLEEIDLEYLKLLRVGHTTMAELTDALGVDSKASNASITRLDQGGYLMREGLWGQKLYTFCITEKGIAQLPVLDDNEQHLAEKGLTSQYVELLGILSTNPEQQLAYIKKHDIKSMRMASICYHLTQNGYVQEKGFFKRKLQITDKGRQMV